MSYDHVSAQPLTAAAKAEYDAVHSYDGQSWSSAATDSVVSRVRRAAALWPDTACLIEVDTAGAVTCRMSYGELATEIDSVGRRLAGAGIGTGATVGIPVRNSIDHLVELLAVLDLGAAAVVVDEIEPAERRDEQFDRVCDVIIDRATNGDRVRRHVPAGGGFAYASAYADHPTALILYTTGSTAASKAVAQSHTAIIANVDATIAHHGMRTGERMACALPISHVNGLHFGVFATLFSGGTCLLFHRFEPLTYLATLARERAHRATLVPSMLNALGEIRRWPALPDLRYVTSAAAALHAGSAARVWERAGLRVVQGYGLSECMNFATTMPVGLTPAEHEKYVLAADIPAVGLAFDRCQVSIRDGAGREVADGAIGEVCLRGHSMLSAYVGNDEATAEIVRGGWLHTGDLGRLDPGADGRPWLTLVGREKNVAKCGGLSISLEELDRWLLTMPGIADVCCVARPDAWTGEAVTAFYRSSADITVAEILAHCDRRFNTPALRMRAVVVPELPRLRNGKVDRRRLQALAVEV